MKLDNIDINENSVGQAQKEKPMNPSLQKDGEKAYKTNIGV